MQQDMIVILDLGSEQNTLIAREIRDLGVYSEIHPHDITAQQLAALPNVKGIILNGGPNRVVDGVSIDCTDAVYQSGLPILAVDHPAAKTADSLPGWEEQDDARRAQLQAFVFDSCHAQKNWNMENFIADQIALIQQQVGDKQVLLALSGGELARAAKDMGLRTALEVFADRAYEEDGSLVNRRKEGAMITDENEAIARVVRMIKEKKVTAITGKDIPIQADSVCVHGDGAKALAFVEKIRSTLTAEGVELCSLDEIV